MRRPIPWPYWVVLFTCIALIIVQYVALTRFAPYYVVRLVERAAGGTLIIEKARLEFPLTTTLTGVRLTPSLPESAFSIQRIVIRPRWLSLPSRTLWLETVHIEQPFVRLTRTKNGTMLWPSLPMSLTESRASSDAGPPSPMSVALPGRWRVRIDTLQVDDGVVEFVDELPAAPFHGVLHHVSFSMGPMVLPLDQAQTSFAVRSEIVGHNAHAAPWYCSGWVTLTARDLQAACQLGPLPLAAFEPYYQGSGRVQVRVYEATLKSTSQWLARANALEGRVQFELGNLTEGDLSVGGRTVVDVKRLGSEEPRLTAELKITGALDAPSQWRSSFVPGDEQVQQLLQPVLARGIEMIKVPLLGGKIDVNLIPANPEAMTSVGEASKLVQQELEIIAPAGQPEPATAAPEASPTPPTPPAAERAPQPPVPSTPSPSQAPPPGS